MGSHNASKYCNMGSYNEFMYCNFGSYENLTRQCGSFTDFCQSIDSCEYNSKLEDEYSAPVAFVGIYISAASLFCTLAMALDLLSGFHKRKYWFPTKYFSLNAVSITVISVAMKLPLDLSSPMPGDIDQFAKIGSLAFMCTMISNLMPSLASMDNKSLLANVAGLSILVITMIGNVCIQMTTHLVDFNVTTWLIVGELLSLLIVLISFAITLPSSKNILELKYQDKSRTLFNDQNPQQNSIKFEELRKIVERYWIMAESGSPQFVMASNILSSASASICSLNMFIHMVRLYIFVPLYSWKLQSFFLSDLDESVYKWSVIAIAITQTIGLIVGSIAPIFRGVRILGFEKNYLNSIVKDENPLYMSRIQKNWTEKMIGWKESRISSLSSTHRSRLLLHNLKNLLVSLCIIFQEVTIYFCKMAAFFPWLLAKLVVCCSNPILSTVESSDYEEYIDYVLLLEDDIEDIYIPLAKKTIKRISYFMNLFKKKAEKKQHNNLLNFLDESNGFQGVGTFDTGQVPSLFLSGEPEPFNSWSLPIISLTCIAIALPNIEKHRVDKLVKSVGEGLLYTHLVEKSLNKESKYVNFRRATITVWHEVESKRKWFKNSLERSAYRGQMPTDIINLFVENAEEIVSAFSGRGLTPKVIAANSMYRIGKTIMHTYYRNGSALTEDVLFTRLSGMIADILAACLTNIPRVILMKCHESAIEKREASVLAAADLLGRTIEIRKKLETHELPNMDHDKMKFIDKWRHHLRQP